MTHPHTKQPGNPSRHLFTKLQSWTNNSNWNRDDGEFRSSGQVTNSCYSSNRPRCLTLVTNQMISHERWKHDGIVIMKNEAYPCSSVTKLSHHGNCKYSTSNYKPLVSYELYLSLVFVKIQFDILDFSVGICKPILKYSAFEWVIQYWVKLITKETQICIWLIGTSAIYTIT